MGVLDTIGRLFTPQIEARSDPWTDYPGLYEQLALIRRTPRPWRTSSINEALGVPAIFRAVTLISNTAGSLSMEAYRQGQKLPQEETPRIIIRPNPFTTPNEFFRDTAYAMATRGEAWWWIAARDIDGVPLSLYPVPPSELHVSENDRNRLRPDIRWRDRDMRNEDMVQIVMHRESGALRGEGPLQVCGAAVSVSVEAQEWAADFFAGGGLPSAIIKSALNLNEEEAQALKSQWMETPNNMPKVIDPGVESVEAFGIDPKAAQLEEQRQYQNGEAARMFGIPGSLLEYSAAGSSLTYQNVTEVYTQFLRTCLAPNYLEKIEQAMSDLLTRATVARFNVEGLLRADILTRFEVYEKAVTILGQEEAAEIARQAEGFSPGNVETAPVPMALPQAIPALLPENRTALQELRCAKCGRLNGVAAGYAETACKRCGTMVRVA